MTLRDQLRAARALNRLLRQQLKCCIARLDEAESLVLLLDRMMVERDGKSFSASQS